MFKYDNLCSAEKEKSLWQTLFIFPVFLNPIYWDQIEAGANNCIFQDLLQTMEQENKFF